MTIAAARSIARRWVAAHAAGQPGYRGAFTHGSTNWLLPQAALPAGSDLDVLLVLDAPPPQKLGKLVCEGLLLEISYLTAEEMVAEQVLGLSYLAGSFALATLLDDPEGVWRAFKPRSPPPTHAAGGFGGGWLSSKRRSAATSTASLPAHRWTSKPSRGFSPPASPPTSCWSPGCGTRPSAAGTPRCASC